MSCWRWRVRWMTNSPAHWLFSKFSKRLPPYLEVKPGDETKSPPIFLKLWSRLPPHIKVNVGCTIMLIPKFGNWIWIDN
jgi:hypothetical protein